MSYFSNDNRWMTNNLSPPFKTLVKNKNIFMGLKPFLKCVFRYSLDSHIKSCWVNRALQEVLVICSSVHTNGKWEKFCLKKNSLSDRSLTGSLGFSE